MNRTKATVLLSIMAVILILGTVFALVDLDKGQLGLYDYKAYPTTIKLGLDLKGGVYAVYQAKDDGEGDLDTRVEGTADSLEGLLFDKGFTESVITVSGNQIRVEVPDVNDPDEIFTLIGRPANLQLRPEETSDEVTNWQTGYYVTGSDIKDCYPTINENGENVIALQFTDEGTKKFADATTERLDKTITIFINYEKVMSPKVSTVISNGQCTISGGYTLETAQAMATKILAGAFSVELTLIESSTISPTLGENAIKFAIIAGLVGILIIMVYLVCMYRLMGAAACVSLFYYVITLLFILSVFPWAQLTLEGVAGIILSIGMAVDANVIIFSRIVDEARNGKTLRTSVKGGFSKAMSAIVDGNVTTLIGAIVLLLVGAAALKSFAIILIIGIVLSLFTSIVVTKGILNAFLAFEDNKPGIYALSDNTFNNKKSQPKRLQPQKAVATPLGGTTEQSIETEQPKSKKIGFQGLKNKGGTK